RGSTLALTAFHVLHARRGVRPPGRRCEPFRPFWTSAPIPRRAQVSPTGGITPPDHPLRLAGSRTSAAHARA
ncbi:MAG TPA: hypothetical protein VK762_38505, partial [Polyangiaceae bacterium]|nr:hypothetical protein [Polyangiaceae bacterium]